MFMWGYMFERPKIVEKMSEKTWRVTENEKERRIILEIFYTEFHERFHNEECHFGLLSGKTKRKLFVHGTGKLQKYL